MKRFTETSKWDDPWFRGTAGIHKLVFLYVLDRCDNAGFWEVDLECMKFHTRFNDAQIEGALKALERGLKGAKGWVWVKNFLRHQKNDALNPENRAHVQIISLLKVQIERFSEVPEFIEFLGPYKGLLSPTGKGNGTVEVPVKVRRRGVQRGEPLNDPAFDQFWDAYPYKQAKENAEIAWVKKGCAPLLPQILTAIRLLKASSDWTKNEGEFIPLPASWLNRRGWEDQARNFSSRNGHRDPDAGTVRLTPEEMPRIWSPTE